MMGFAIGISDIRVSWGDHHEDCLQKIHNVGPDIAVAFAGSVRFGFWATRDLRGFLEPPETDWAWSPRQVALKWHRRARRAFTGLPDADRNLSASVMLMGVSPIEDMGIPGWARPCVSIMRSPDFFPRFLDINAVEAIGSGASVTEFNDLLQRLEDSALTRTELETGKPGASAESLRDAIFQILQEHPQINISRHIHMCVVRRGYIEIVPSNFTFVPAEGGIWSITDPEAAKLLKANSWDVRMPPVVSTWEQYEARCARNGLTAVAGSC